MARRAYRSSACIASRARRAEIISQVLGSDTWLPFMLSLIHSNDQPAMEVLFSVRRGALELVALPVRRCALHGAAVLCVLRQTSVLPRPSRSWSLFRRMLGARWNRRALRVRLLTRRRLRRRRRRMPQLQRHQLPTMSPRPLAQCSKSQPVTETPAASARPRSMRRGVGCWRRAISCCGRGRTCTRPTTTVPTSSGSACLCRPCSRC